MSKHTCFLLIVFLSLLGLAAAGASAGQTPVIHENPASLTTQQSFDVNGKLMLQLEQMFGSLDKVALNINLSQFDLSRLSMKDFDRDYQFFQDYLNRTSISGSDFQRITGQADITAEQLRDIINSSEAFNDSMASFEMYWDKGDTHNATIAAADLQKYYGMMNNSSQQLSESASVISRALQNTSVNINPLYRGIDTLSSFMDRIDELNQLPKSLLGNTSLVLNASLKNVSTGDSVLFTARLTSNNTTISGGLISLYIDGQQVANATSGADGICNIYHTIRGGTFNDTINALAYYDPQGAEYTPAVSNNVGLERNPITPDLTISMMPESSRFGDTVHVEGRLTADGGFPVPDHPVSLNFSDMIVGYVNTSDDGSYSCDINITSHIQSGNMNVSARYEADDVPGEALANATSPNVPLYVAQDTTSLALDKPSSVLSCGDQVSFTGALSSASGQPVEGDEVSFYAGDIRLGSNNTDATGRYNLSLAIPRNLTAGTYPVFAAYNPPGGMSLSGSQSNEYEVEFKAAPPTITVYGIPLIAFQGDTLNFLVNVTAKDTPVNGSLIAVSMADRTLGSGLTDIYGTLLLVNQINGSAGLQTVKVYSEGSGLLEETTVDTVTLLIMPFDLLTSLAIFLVIIAVLGLVLARVTRSRRAISRRQPAVKTPLPKPTLKVTPLPEPQADWGIRPEPTGFEDEVSRINAIIAGGADNREVMVEIYLAARRVTGAHGLAVPESSTHREFYKKLIAQEPRLNVSAGTITRHYETAVFGCKPLSEKDIVGSLYSLKEINTLIDGRQPGGGA